MSMGGGHSTTTTTQELSPEQRALIAPVIPIAKQFLATPPKMYPGSGIVNFNPLQRQAQQMTMQAANNLLPTTSQIPGEFNRTQQQANFLSSGDVLRPESNPALQGAIEAATRPTLQQFQEQIMPSITGQSVGAGGYGGTRQGIAEGIAARGATQAAADIASQMANTNYQAGLGAMTSGLQTQEDLLKNASPILSQTLLPAQMKEGVGQQQQAMQQALLSEKVQRYINQQMIPFSAAQDVASMAFGMPGGTTRSEGTQPGNPAMGMQLAGSALGLLPMLAGSSDRRLKNVIKKVGHLADGLGVYIFSYIGTVWKHIGLLADEVEKLYPEAVGTVMGYKQVDYRKVPSWMEI